MFINDRVAGSWPELLLRLARRDALASWAKTDPRLVGLVDVEGDLLPALERGACHVRAQQITAALVRLAAADGGDDVDALSLLLHLCSDWVGSLSRQLQDLAPDILFVIVGELACRVRTYPWQRRRGSTMANLRLDTRHAVLREFRPALRAPGAFREVVVAPHSAVWDAMGLGVVLPTPDVDLADLLQWALATGIDRSDLQLLIRTEQARADSTVTGDAALQVAAEFGMSEATSRRRRCKALHQLRAAAQTYLAAA